MNGVYWMLAGDRLRAFDVQVQDGRLQARPSGESAHGFLIPGFVDIHIHGAFGIDFMSATNPQMLELAARLGDCGYEHFLPTTVSASADEVSAALSCLPPDDRRMPGFHLEGPFVSEKYPGAQPPDAIVDPLGRGQDWDVVLADARLKVATIAPERPGAHALILQLSQRGVRASMGHTNATFEEARAGFAAGISHATHTFNAMRPFHHREAGAVGFILTEDEVYAELIYDRHHVSKEAVELLLQSKPKSKVIAVSDSTMATGLPSGTKLAMWGLHVETRPGTVYIEGTETLAGSAITLLDAFCNLAEDFGLETAIRLCCLNPRKTLGIQSEPSVWVEFDSDLTLRTIHSLI